MTVSAVEIIRAKREAIEFGGIDQARTVLTTSETDGLYESVEITPDVISGQLRAIDRILGWIDENVAVVPTPVSGLPEDMYAVMRVDWPAYLADSMQLAAHMSRILVADDLGLEVIAGSLGVEQAPTAAVLRAAMIANRITPIEFARGLYELTKANFEFVSFSEDDLWVLTDFKAQTTTSEVNTMLGYLRARSLNLESGLVVTLRYLRLLIEREAPIGVFTASLTVALSALCRHGTRETSTVFAVLGQFSLTQPQRYSVAARVALSCWLQGHFMSIEEVHPQPPAGRSARPKHVRKHRRM